MNVKTDASRSVSWSVEILAGITTYLTMAYIVVVNPAILSAAGMPKDEVFFATCVSSAAATVVMALWARYPFALAPGMGMNAFFAFTVCGQLGVPWPAALSAVLVAGVIFLALSVVGLRERFVAAVPEDLVRAIAGGIGLFIAFIGLEHAGIVRGHPETLVTMGDLTSPPTLVASGGLALTAALVAARVPGAVIVGIAATAVAAFATGVAPPPEALVSLPALPRQTLGAAILALPDLLRPDIVPVVFTLVFLALFDTMGTLLALGHASGAIGPDGRMPRISSAFAADAVGSIIGAVCGTSTVTTYIESASGVVAGGRTGRTALVTAALLILTLPFLPLVAAVPAVATAPALVVVGGMMFASVSEIRWRDPAVAVPALVTILAMPATFNISNGLGLGFVLWAVTHLAARRAREVRPPTWIIAGAFVAYFALRLSG